jgi:hypothetical protein
MTATTVLNQLTDTLEIQVMAKYPAKQWINSEQVDRPGYINMKCAILGATIWLNCENAKASQMQVLQPYQVTYKLEKSITAKGIIYKPEEIIDFKSSSKA